MRLIDRAEVRERLTYAAVHPDRARGDDRFFDRRDAPAAAIDHPAGRGAAVRIMPGALAADGPFGAKLISVFAGNAALKGRCKSHQGVVVIFDPETGEPVRASPMPAK